MKHISLNVLCLLLAAALLLGIFPIALAAELPESSGQPTETTLDESTTSLEEATEPQPTEPAQETEPPAEEDTAIEKIPIATETPISPQGSITGNLTRSDISTGNITSGAMRFVPIISLTRTVLRSQPGWAVFVSIMWMA